MAKKVVEIIFKIKDRISPSLSRIRSGLAGARTALGALAKAGAAAFAALSAGAIALGAAVKKAFDFETSKVQLKALLGTVQAANQRFSELREFSAKTPFQLPDILKASRLMTVFSEGVLGGAKSLQTIGDAAAVAGQGISDVSFWVGRAYSMIQGGKPFGEAAMRLQEMGILTARGREDMENLQKSGASAQVVFARLTQEMERFRGGMTDLSQTGNGLISTLKDNWTIAVATFGEAFADAAKEGLQTAIDKIQELIESGDIERWAQNSADKIDELTASIKRLVSNIEQIQHAWRAVKEPLDRINSTIKKVSKAAVEATAGPVGQIAKRITAELVQVNKRMVEVRKEQAREAGDAEIESIKRVARHREAEHFKSIADVKAETQARIGAEKKVLDTTKALVEAAEEKRKAPTIIGSMELTPENEIKMIQDKLKEMRQAEERRGAAGTIRGTSQDVLRSENLAQESQLRARLREIQQQQISATMAGAISEGESKMLSVNEEQRNLLRTISERVGGIQ